MSGQERLIRTGALAAGAALGAGAGAIAGKVIAKHASKAKPIAKISDDLVAGGSKIHPVTGVPFNAAGFPVFKSVYDFKLPHNLVGSAATDARQFAAATRSLRAHIEGNRALRRQFTAEQLSAIEAGKARIPGYTWHHHEDGLRLQLVDRATHAATGHRGGRATTGGRR